MFHYLLVFEYTKNSNSYKTNKVITLDQEFSVDDLGIQEAIASKENGQKSRLIGIYQIERSREPK